MNGLMSLLTPANWAALALGLAFMVFWWLAKRRIARGYRPSLRPISGYDALRRAAGLAAETGRPLHVSTGSAGIGDAFTVETLAGLTVLDGLAQPAATGAAPLLVTTASPVVVAMAQEMLRRAYERAGYAEELDSLRVRFMAPNANAYAAATASLVSQERVGTSALVGSFGDEFLLLGEAGARDGVVQVAGTAQAYSLPFVFATADHPILGEEIFAAGAYLSGRVTHLAGLMAQDRLRLVVIGVILGGALLRTLTLR